MKLATDTQRGRTTILRELALCSPHRLLTCYTSDVLHLMYLMKFVGSNTRPNMLLCLSHILKVADPEYRITLYELFMPKNSQDDTKFLGGLIKTNCSNAVKIFLKRLAGRNYFPTTSFMSTIFYLKASQHSNFTFYFARFVTNHYEWLERELGQEDESMLQQRLEVLIKVQEYYTALCLERYFYRFPEYVNWITESMAKIIETTPSDQWVLRMSYLSTSRCESIVNAYYQQTPLIILKCYEHVTEVQEQNDFFHDLSKENRTRNDSISHPNVPVTGSF